MRMELLSIGSSNLSSIHDNNYIKSTFNMTSFIIKYLILLKMFKHVIITNFYLGTLKFMNVVLKFLIEIYWSLFFDLISNNNLIPIVNI